MSPGIELVFEIGVLRIERCESLLLRVYSDPKPSWWCDAAGSVASYIGIAFAKVSSTTERFAQVLGASVPQSHLSTKRTDQRVFQRRDDHVDE